MDPKFSPKILFFAAICGISFFNINAQDTKSKIRIKMEKDGKVIKDTVYEVNDDVNPEIVSRILDIALSESQGDGNFLSFHSDDGKVYEFHREDDEISEKADSGKEIIVSSSEGEDGGTRVTVKKIKVMKDGEMEWKSTDESVLLYNAGKDGNPVYKIDTNGEKPQWIERDGNKILILNTGKGDPKNVKVISDDDSDYTFSTEEGETIIITTDESNGESEVKVEVIKDDKKSEDIDKEKQKDEKVIKSKRIKKDEN